MKIILLFLTIATGFDKLCVNCKHFKKNIFTPARYAKCKKFGRVDYSVEHLITGKKKENTEYMYYCSTARSYNHLCGEEGVGYEGKK